MAPDDRKPSAGSTARASAGFARAVAPETAQAISTDAVGLITSDVRIPTRDGELPAFEAHPATGSAYPVVLVVHEIFGVHEHIPHLQALGQARLLGDRARVIRAAG